MDFLMSNKGQAPILVFPSVETLITLVCSAQLPTSIKTGREVRPERIVLWGGGGEEKKKKKKAEWGRGGKQIQKSVGRTTDKQE